MTEQARVEHVSTWEEFKRLATAAKPQILFYTIQRAPLAKPPIALRLVFAAQQRQYVFLDFPEGSRLRQTRIPIKTNRHEEATIDDKDITAFIKDTLNLKNLKVKSMEVLGY